MAHQPPPLRGRSVLMCPSRPGDVRVTPPPPAGTRGAAATSADYPHADTGSRKKILSDRYVQEIARRGSRVKLYGMNRRGPSSVPVGVTRLELMRPKARALLPGDSVPIEVLGTQGRVLRLLALSAGHCFSSEWLADFLRYSTPASVAPMIMQLRTKLGGAKWGALIQSDHGVGYQLDSATVDVDAFDFKDRTECLVQLYRKAAEPDDIPVDEADENLDVIERALSGWRVNPAIGLENITAHEHQYYYEYDSLRVIHGSVQKCRPITAEMVVANVARATVVGVHDPPGFEVRDNLLDHGSGSC